jgi:hypothetical protein
MWYYRKRGIFKCSIIETPAAIIRIPTFCPATIVTYYYKYYKRIHRRCMYISVIQRNVMSMVSMVYGQRLTATLKIYSVSYTQVLYRTIWFFVNKNLLIALLCFILVWFGLVLSKCFSCL